MKYKAVIVQFTGDAGERELMSFPSRRLARLFSEWAKLTGREPVTVANVLWTWDEPEDEPAWLAERLRLLGSAG